MKHMNSIFILALTVLVISCAATETILQHSSLQTDTKLSQTVFIAPVTPSQKTIYVVIKNTSQEQISLKKPLENALRAKGYKVTTQSNRAHYILQANVLKVGKMSVAASQLALGGGYGSAIAGAVAGTAAGGFTQSNTGMIAGGLAGGVIGMAADSLVKDVNYSMITDIQISERVGKSIKVNEQFQSQLKNGSGSMTYQTSSRDSQYQCYRTRVISNANKVNLKFQDARASLEQGLVKVISGIF